MGLSSEAIRPNTAPIRIFQTNGLNDERRTSLVSGGFIAIDPNGALEIDDAIRITSDGQLFTLDVAVADGGQLDHTHELFHRALQVRHNTYTEERPKRILPRHVVDALDLNGRGPRRALVIRQVLDRYLEPYDIPRLIPATVEVTRYSYLGFSLSLLQSPHDSKEKELQYFDQLFREKFLLPRDSLANAESLSFEELTEHSQGIVQTFMVVANMAVASWAADTDTPVIHRSFSVDGLRKPRSANQEAVLAYYTVDQLPHHGIAGFPEGISYTHTTSPMRRTADLINHIIIARRIAGLDPPFTQEDLTGFCQQLSPQSA